MIKFIHLVEKVNAIKAAGKDAFRHAGKYVTPYVQADDKGTSKKVPNAAKKFVSFKNFDHKSVPASRSANINLKYSHTTAKDSEVGPAGTKVAIRGTHVDDKGKRHVELSPAPGAKSSEAPKSLDAPKKTEIVSKVLKPISNDEAETDGHRYEASFHKRMADHGLADKNAGPAGSTAGADVVVHHKSGKKFNGEVKADTTAAMGQITIKHDPKKGGWHIPDESRAKRPKYAEHVEKAGILKQMNDHHHPDKAEITKSGRAKSLVMKHDNMDPADAYLQDHHAHFVHVGSHGTYRVGDKDHTGHGLPKLEGEGKWTVRDKHVNKNSRTVQFQPGGVKALKKSSVHLDNDDHLDKFKKSLGH